MRALAIIPVRAFSGNPPGKYLRPLGGKPLLAYTLEAASASGLFDRIVVATDSEEIAVLARDFGVDIPFVRPRELDLTGPPSLLQVLQHATLYLTQRDGPFDVICTLRASIPFRNLASIRNAHQLLASDPTADSAVSVVASHARGLPLHCIDGGYLGRAQTSSSEPLQQPLYAITGQFCFTRVPILLESNSLFGKRSIPIVVPEQTAIDINSEEDFQRAESLLKSGFPQG